MVEDQVMCACGRPIHYRNHKSQVAIEKLAAQLGPEVEVVVGDRKYAVQRHYIALHGLNAQQLENLADQGIVRRV
jgi:hypothetical protein